MFLVRLDENIIISTVPARLGFPVPWLLSFFDEVDAERVRLEIVPGLDES